MPLRASGSFFLGDPQISFVGIRYLKCKLWHTIVAGARYRRGTTFLKIGRRSDRLVKTYKRLKKNTFVVFRRSGVKISEIVDLVNKIHLINGGCHTSTQNGHTSA